jgi:hypothetical protein
MSTHLNYERISRSLLDAPDDADREHLAECAACRGEVEEFERTLRAMRGSVRQWSEVEYASAGTAPPRTLARPILTTAWSAVFLMALLLARAPRKQTPVISAGYGDAQLMDEVRADLARPVPRSMEALLP